MAEIVVTDLDGVEHSVQGRAGVSVMETLREFEFGVAAICGGMCSCATCHVYLTEPWAAQAPAMQGDEKEILQELDSYQPGRSRLCCQVPFEESMDGMRVEIARDE